METYVVTSKGLNLRSEPRETPNNKLTVLPQATPVVVLDKAHAPWWRVRADLSGATFEGFVSSRHLERASDHQASTASAAGGRPPPVHYGENDVRVTRRRPAGAKPLGEAGMPRANGSPAKAFFREFVNWAQVDNDAHLRWRPGSGRTYCNIYAHDFAYAAGVYLPRVWWKPDAIRRLAKGEEVEIAYDRTIREMNANSLHDWLLDHGRDYGWQRATSLDSLQAAVNDGQFGVICAARKDPNRSGHITVVIPEGPEPAARGPGGLVTRPLQSQAGSSNYRLGTGNRPWWAGSEFRSFVFFRNPAA